MQFYRRCIVWCCVCCESCSILGVLSLLHTWCAYAKLTAVLSHTHTHTHTHTHARTHAHTHTRTPTHTHTQVLQHELRSVREACMKLEEGYEPGITFVIVQKRHHTRLFCSDGRDMVCPTSYVFVVCTSVWFHRYTGLMYNVISGLNSLRTCMCLFGSPRWNYYSVTYFKYWFDAL